MSTEPPAGTTKASCAWLTNSDNADIHKKSPDLMVGAHLKRVWLQSVTLRAIDQKQIHQIIDVNFSVVVGIKRTEILCDCRYA